MNSVYFVGPLRTWEHTGGIESTSVIGNFGIYIQISDSNGENVQFSRYRGL